MFTKAIVFALGVMLPTQCAFAQQEERSPSPVVDVKVDRILKVAFSDAFKIGMAGDLPNRYSDEELKLASDHFNAITPENCMKPERVHPGATNWQFEPTDALVAWAEKHQMTVHGHTLVWHQQTPEWFFEGGDKEVVTGRLKDHIHTIVGRYRGRLQSWDVVNEAINDGGNSETGRPRIYAVRSGCRYLVLSISPGV